MKKQFWTLGLILLCFLWISVASGSPSFPEEAPYTALHDTGYEVQLPLGWTTIVSEDESRSLIDSQAPDETHRLLVYCNRHPGWHLSDWKDALHKAGRNNSVHNIQETALEDRPYLVFESELADPVLPDIALWSAVTELTDGVFATFEFRTVGDGSPSALDASVRDAILTSLRAATDGDSAS